MAATSMKVLCLTTAALVGQVACSVVEDIQEGRVGKNKLEIVLAQYNEDLGWSDKFAPVRTVYCKGQSCPTDSTQLSNVGREGHTFLWHLVHHYDDLADWTVFSQAGEPSEGYFGKGRGGGHLLNGVAFEDYLEPHGDSKFLMSSKVHLPTLAHSLRSTFKVSPDDDEDLLGTTDASHSCPAGGTDAWGPYKAQLWLSDFLSQKCGVETAAISEALRVFWEDTLDMPLPPGNVVHFTQGARFAVSRERLHQRPRSFYESLLSMLESEDDSCFSYIYEWAWYYIAGKPVEAPCKLDAQEATGDLEEIEQAERILSRWTDNVKGGISGGISGGGGGGSYKSPEIEWVGKAPKFKIYPSGGKAANSSWMMLTFGKIQEVDADGKTVSSRSINSLAAEKDITWSQAEMDIGGAAATVVTMTLPVEFKQSCRSSTLASPDYSSVTVEIVLFSDYASITYGSETFEVSPGQIKFNIESEAWPFCADTDSLQFTLDIKMPSGSKTNGVAKKDKEKAKGKSARTVYSASAGGSNVTMDLPQMALIDDVESNCTIDVETKGVSTSFTFTFPYFASSLVYDPTVGFDDDVAENTELADATTTFIGTTTSMGEGGDGGSNGDDGTSDSSASDDGASDDGTSDDGTTDDGTSDDGTTDDGASDDGTTDDGTTDDGTTDDGTTDDSTTDDGTTDDGTTDDGTTDDGTTDDGATDDGTTDDSTTDDGTTDDSTTDDSTTDDSTTDDSTTDDSTTDDGTTDDSTTDDNTTNTTEEQQTREVVTGGFSFDLGEGMTAEEFVNDEDATAATENSFAGALGVDKDDLDMNFTVASRRLQQLLMLRRLAGSVQVDYKITIPVSSGTSTDTSSGTTFTASSIVASISAMTTDSLATLIATSLEEAGIAVNITVTTIAAPEVGTEVVPTTTDDGGDDDSTGTRESDFAWTGAPSAVVMLFSSFLLALFA